MIALIWRETALADLESILAYVAERNPVAADRLQDTIEACAERVHVRPFLYRVGRVQGFREAVAHPNYILVYRVTADAVEIMNVLHTRRRYP